MLLVRLLVMAHLVLCCEAPAHLVLMLNGSHSGLTEPSPFGYWGAGAEAAGIDRPLGIAGTHSLLEACLSHNLHLLEYTEPSGTLERTKNRLLQGR